MISYHAALLSGFNIHVGLQLKAISREPISFSINQLFF